MYIHTEFEYIKKIKTNFLQHENMFGNVYKNIFRYSWYIKKKMLLHVGAFKFQHQI